MRAVCIDDENLALEFMTRLLKKSKNIKVIETFQSAQKGLDFILQEPVDVVFLDIEMPEINGLQLAEQILEKKPYIDIVFVTAYNEYAVRAFELNAIDYLMKPVKLERLQQTIDRLEKEQANKPEIEEKAKQLNIQLGYNVSFALENEAFAPLKWRTTKARELFLYLLQNKDTLVHKGALMERLWGEDELDRGYSILYTTVYNVRKALQTYAAHLELKNTNDGYMLALDNVQVDLQAWEKALKELPDEITESTIELYKEAMALNSGPYLDELDYIWIEAEKQRLENLWITTMEKITDYYLNQARTNEAIESLKQIVERAPEREEAHLTLMKIYANQAQDKLIKAQYDTYVSSQQAYGLRPSPKVKKWFTDYLDSSS